MNELSRRAENGLDDRDTLHGLVGDFREFRGEMRTRMDNFDRALGDGIREIRESATSATATSAKLADLEGEDLSRRVTLLEANWRLALWIGGVVAVLTIGLFADLVRTWIFGA